MGPRAAARSLSAYCDPGFLRGLGTRAENALRHQSQRDIPGRRKPAGTILCKDLFVSGINLFEAGGW